MEEKKIVKLENGEVEIRVKIDPEEIDMEPKMMEDTLIIEPVGESNEKN